MRVLAICLEKPVQSTRCIGAKVFDLIRSLSPSLHNLWLLLVEKGMMGREREGVVVPFKLCFIPILSLPTTQWGLCGGKRYTRVYSRNWPIRVKWAPFCNFRRLFFKKGGPPKGIWTCWYRLFHEKMNVYWRFAAILKHSGQLKKPVLELLHNLGCSSGEIMTQMKKRKAIETVIKSVLLLVTLSNTFIKTIVLIHGSIFWRPIWHGNVNFMQHFFPNCRNPTRPCSRINPVHSSSFLQELHEFLWWKKKN